LSRLTAAAAEALARRKGDLALDGLTTLSDPASNALVRHEGTLRLNSLWRSPTLKQMAPLVVVEKHKGDLYLDGLKSLALHELPQLTWTHWRRRRHYQRPTPPVKLHPSY